MCTLGRDPKGRTRSAKFPAASEILRHVLEQINSLSANPREVHRLVEASTFFRANLSPTHIFTMSAKDDPTPDLEDG